MTDPCVGSQRIVDLDDPRIAPFRDLPARRSQSRDALFIVEGRWLVERDRSLTVQLRD